MNKTENDNKILQKMSDNIAVDWKFDSEYCKSGSLESNDLIIRDASGNGNDLRLNTERIADGENAASYMMFVKDNIYGEEVTECLRMGPENTEIGKKTGVFFETVADAPVNRE